ncbi:Protein kinase domain-containing protein [Mycena indigotica]|uniref:Protein kinase domain-containing protein n=1 Tax=Mycena indigotica TaxID=2126181 RepID=A0A8H6W6V0_9AGAR|nr:Protein kinase domain-containing protein [Mycena indigotica]KAF7303798.1 Protein kinase domain-containing protein [Mycena indigotica]
MRLTLTLLVALTTVRAISVVPTRHAKRDLLDLCAVIPPGSDISLNLLGIPIDVELALCLCLQGLDIYLATHDDVNLQNQQIADVNAKVNALTSYNRPPPNEMRICDGSGPYICVDGFIRCNGVCVPGTSCPTGPSGLPRARKRDINITTLKKAQIHCGPSKTVCGSAHPRHSYDFECINTETDFDNCGGCLIPHPFQPDARSAVGEECGAIRNAHSVSCKNSKCVVQKCRRGFSVNTKRNGCDSKQNKAVRGLLDGVLGSGPAGAISGPLTSAALPSTFAQPLSDVISAANGVASVPGAPADVTQPVLNQVHNVLGTTDPTQLVPNVQNAIDATKTAQAGCSQCSGGLLSSIQKLLDSLLSVNSLCPGGTPPTVPAPPSCLDVTLTNVVCGLLPSVYVSPLLVCGLGGGLTSTLQGVVNSLGLGLQPIPFPTCCVGLPPPGNGTSVGPGSGSSSSMASLPSLPSPSLPAPPAPSVSISSPSPPPSDTINVLCLLTLQLVVKLNGGGGPTCNDGLIGTVNGLVKGLLGKPLIGGDGIVQLGPSGVDVNKLASALPPLPASNAVSGLPLLGGLLGGLRRRDLLNGLLDGLLGSCGKPLLDDVENLLGQLLGGLNACGCGAEVAKALPGSIPPSAIVPSVPISPPSMDVTVPSPDAINVLGLLTLQLAVKINGGGGPSCNDGLIGVVNNLVKGLLGKPLIGGDGIVQLGPGGVDINKLGSALPALGQGLPLVGSLTGALDKSRRFYYEFCGLADRWK